MKQTKFYELKHSFLLLITAIIWGIAFVAQKDGMKTIGPLMMSGTRFILGGLSLIPVILIFERKGISPLQKKNSYIYGIIAGCVLYFAVNLQQYGILFTGSSGKAAFITAMYTIIVPIFGLFLGKKTSLLTWLGVALALVGLYFISFNNDFSISHGDIFLIVGAFFWAAHIMMVDSYVPKVAALRFSMTQFYVCAVLSLITIIPLSQSFMQGTPFYETFTFDGMAEGIVPLLYTGILSSGIAYTLQIVGQKGVAPAKAAIIFSCESLFGALGGWLFAGEVMTPRSYIGCALMFCGIIASQLQIGKKRRKERLEEELNKV